MLISYIRLAWRNLSRHRLFGILNILGLSAGMAVSFLLLLYVHHEYSYDRFNPDADRVYLVHKNQPFNGLVRTKNLSPEPLAAVLQKDYPEIDKIARTTNPVENLILSAGNGNTGIRTGILAADSSLTDIFRFQFLAGDSRHPLTRSSIMLTNSVARALFGNLDPVGKTVTLAGQHPLTVTAVIADQPSNSSLEYKAIISWAALLSYKPWVSDGSWDNYAYNTYVKLRPGANAANMSARIKNLIGKYHAGDNNIFLFLYPLTKLHLYDEFQNGVNVGGRISYVQLFLILAIGILVVACINFMNLATARSQRRAREVGVRKAIGAGRTGLIGLFLTESLLLSFLALGLSLGITAILLPVWDRLIHIPLSLPLANIQAWGAALGLTVLTGLLAGSYPALYLSSFRPIKVLKGQLIDIRSAAIPRQALVVLQFSFSTALILSSIFIYRQIEHIRDRPIGYQREGLIEMSSDGRLVGSLETFRHELVASGAATDAAMTSAAITDNTASAWSVIWPDQRPGEDKIPIDCIATGYHFTATYGLQITQGRDFDPGHPADSASVLLNESAVRLMRMRQPIGQTITWLGSRRKVVGVIKDFVWGSPFEPTKPAIMGFVPDWSGNIGIRLNPARPLSANLAQIESIYKKYNPGYPFEYHFTDEEFSRKTGNERLLGSISLGFTCLAIFISCLGLFGLSAFSAEQRRKELGIRKVLGASAVQLWFRLSKEFIALVVLAFLIGASTGWYYIHQWLSHYSYHTGFSIGIFLLTLTLSVMICLAAVSWQTLRAAWANPVRSLKNE